MSYRKHLMPSDMPPSELYKATEVGTEAINCVMVMKGIRSGKSATAEAVDCAKRIIADNIRQLPSIRPVNNSENPKSLDVVSRQAAKNAICNACGKIDCDEMDTCKKLDIPSARSKALEWQYHSYIPHNKYCPKCKKDSPYNKRWNFCPNCGVDMRGERDG